MSARRVGPAVVLLVLALAPAARDAGAQARGPRASVIAKEPPVIYMEVDETASSKFHGDGLTTNNAKPTDIVVHTLDFELTAPVDARTGNIAGRPAYKPLVITHDVGPSTTQFLGAAARNQNLKNVTLTVWKVGARDRNGMASTAKDYVIQLEDAHIATVRQFTEESRLLEEIAFTYRKISTTYVNGGYTFAENSATGGAQ